MLPSDDGSIIHEIRTEPGLVGKRAVLHDFPDRRLIPIEHPAVYPTIAPLLGKRIRADVIREHWDEVMRLVASLKAGHVAPSVMLRKLAAYERQNQVGIALQEIGKIERTLFMLDWLENPLLRRRCQAGLNKSEQRHALTHRSSMGEGSRWMAAS